MSSADHDAYQKLFGHEQAVVAAGASAVLDVRGMKGFVVVLNGGTATWQQCDEDGTVVPGSAPTAAESGTVVENPWPFVLVTATTAAAVVALI